MALTACGSPGSSGDSQGNSETTTIYLTDPPTTMTWTPPTTYLDGSPLNSISGYRLYYGPTQGAMQLVLEIPNVGSSYTLSQSEIDDIADTMVNNSTHLFALTILDFQGLESSYSNVVQLVKN